MMGFDEKIDGLSIQEKTVLLPMDGDLAYYAVVISDIGEKYSLNAKYPLRIKGDALLRVYRYALETNYYVHPAYIGVDTDGSINVDVLAKKEEGSVGMDALEGECAKCFELIDDVFRQITALRENEEERKYSSDTAGHETYAGVDLPLPHEETSAAADQRIPSPENCEEDEEDEEEEEPVFDVEMNAASDIADMLHPGDATASVEEYAFGKGEILPEADAQTLWLGEKCSLEHILAHIRSTPGAMNRSD